MEHQNSLFHSKFRLHPLNREEVLRKATASQQLNTPNMVSSNAAPATFKDQDGNSLGICIITLKEIISSHII